MGGCKGKNDLKNGKKFYRSIGSVYSNEEFIVQVAWSKSYGGGCTRQKRFWPNLTENLKNALFCENLKKSYKKMPFLSSPQQGGMGLGVHSRKRGRERSTQCLSRPKQRAILALKWAHFSPWGAVRGKMT